MAEHVCRKEKAGVFRDLWTALEAKVTWRIFAPVAAACLAAILCIGGATISLMISRASQAQVIESLQQTPAKIDALGEKMGKLQARLEAKGVIPPLADADAPAARKVN